MQRISWCLIVIALALLTIGFQSAARAQESTALANSIPTGIPSNGGFETGDFTSWSLSDPVGAWTISPSDKHTGNYSAHVLSHGVAPYWAASLASDFYQVTGFRHGSLAFWTKAPQIANGGKLLVLVEWYDVAHQPLGSDWQIIQDAPVLDWTKYEISILPRSNAFFLRIYLAAQAFSGDVIEAYVDDVSLSLVYDSALFLPLLSHP